MTVHLYEGAILMKIWLSAMLALMLLLCASASAEEDWEDYAAFEAFVIYMFHTWSPFAGNTVYM
jgi:hypothetical protein